jgi:phage shock protein C
MTAYATSDYRRFTRDADRAMVGGVCAGIARHFGFNLCVTRFLYVIFFFAAMPFAVIAYLAAVFLVPTSSRTDEYVVERVVRRCRARKMSRREKREAADSARRAAEEEVRRRARSLEERLARIEKRVTSRRYQLEEEFRNL